MGFGKKAAALFGLGPDIAVVPECSKHPISAGNYAGNVALSYIDYSLSQGSTCRYD